MGLMFWRKTREVSPPAKPQVSVEVTEDNPLPVRIFTDENDDAPRFQIDQKYLPPVAGQQTPRLVKVTGIGTGAAYADGEAFGGMLTFHDVFGEKCSGTIVKVLFYDLDDEGIQIDVPLFIRAFTVTTDNNAFAPTDSDLLSCKGVVSVSNFYNWNVNQFGENDTVRKWVQGADRNLYTQLVVRGAANIAAGSEPWIEITVVPD